MNCTIISRGLDLLKENFYNGTPYAPPRSYLIAADNTARESKNQTFVAFQAWLAAKRVVEDCEFQCLQVHHTHNDLDQRFGSIGALLSSAGVLETPEDFRDFMASNLSPVPGRKLIVEVLPGTMDFHSWLHGLSIPLQVQGLTATEHHPDTCHSWHFIRRSAYKSLIGDDQAVDVLHKVFSELPHHGDDIILIVKQFMHSTHAAQNPVLFLPRVVAMSLQSGELKPSLLSILPESSIKEFTKTALAIEKPPWHLLRAAEYLREIISAKKVSKAVDLKFIFENEVQDIQCNSGVQLPYLEHSRPAPRLISVAAPSASTMRDRQQRKRSVAEAFAEDGQPRTHPDWISNVAWGADLVQLVEGVLPTLSPHLLLLDSRFGI